MRSGAALRRLRMVADSIDAQQANVERSAGSLPWWVRYTRWRQTSRKEAEAGEAKLLSLCDADLEVKDVTVGSGREERMHTISGGPASGLPLVCIPGYGAGAGFYYRNVEGFAKQFRFHLVDLLGTGMSGRPPFRARSRQEAEDFFLDALAKWHEELGLGKMVLLGHSLGGYLAASYALRYPEHVEHLILVCSAGMSEPQHHRPTPEWARNPWTWRGQLFRLSQMLWDRGVTPGSIIRTLGPWGPRLIHGYARNRFREGMGMTEAETAAFEDYFYHITAARGSGEHALTHLLGPFAWARHPLRGRLHELEVPLSLIYGEHDWMKPENGRQELESMMRQRGKLSPADLQFDVIPDAGHYAFLDQPEVFLHRLLKQTQPYLASKGASKAGELLREAERAGEEALRQRRSTDAPNLDI